MNTRAITTIAFRLLSAVANVLSVFEEDIIKVLSFELECLKGFDRNGKRE